MGVYSLDDLIRRWQTGQLTLEQAVGQILLLLKDLVDRMRELERARPY